MKLEGTKNQYEKLDGCIRTGRFVRNSIIKAWMDGQVKSRNDAYAYCKVLSDNPEFPWAKQLNSMARQAHAERAWAAIDRFYGNCIKKIPGKKGFPKFKKHQMRASVEYKTSGWVRLVSSKSEDVNQSVRGARGQPLVLAEIKPLTT